jgi:hypothetical protein
MGFYCPAFQMLDLKLLDEPNPAPRLFQAVAYLDIFDAAIPLIETMDLIKTLTTNSATGTPKG